VPSDQDSEIEREVRAALEGASKASLAFPRERLVELGWDELFAAEPQVAVSTLFEEMGRLLLTGPALDMVVLSALGDQWPAEATQVLYPVPGTTALIDDGGTLSGVTLDALDPAGLLVAPISTGSAIQIHTLQTSACEQQPVRGLDESQGLYRIQADAAAASPTEHAGDWDLGLITARRALSHQLIGVSGELLRIAVDHVCTREQFGRPLGANQAVQHRLADARVDLTAAQELTAEAWLTESPLVAALAKGMASRAFETVAMHGQQVLGGIGYTWEHSWRHPLRRGMFLSAFLGAGDECESEIGSELVSAGVPRIGNVAGASR
jgi:Acyl-CoA dehydrogenase, C-terminal domain